MLNNLTNLFNLITGRMVKTKAEPSDIVVLGTRDSRYGGGYKPTVITFQDLEAQIQCGKDTLKTDIFDEYPFPITPVMLSTCTRVEDNLAFPINLQGYKVSGMIQLSGDSSYSEYLGSVEIATTGIPLFLPWKTTGTVTTYDGINNVITNPFGLFNSVGDSAGGLTYAQIVIVGFPYSGPGLEGLDLVMFVDPTSISPVVGDIEAVVAFEWEFLIDDTLTPTFTIY
jgi:hypothetical protein